MKKLFSIFLIISFLFNTVGYLLIYLSLQSNLKEEAFIKITTEKNYSDNIVISFAKADLLKGISELRFYEEDEFLFKGKMYDVIKTENTKDSVRYYCLSDTDEDELNLVFNKNGKGEGGDKNPAGQNLLKNLLQDGIISINTNSPDNNFQLNYFKESKCLYNPNFIEVPTLPPVFHSV